MPRKLVDPKILWMPRKRIPDIISTEFHRIEFERVEMFFIENGDIHIVMKSGYVRVVSGDEAKSLWYALHGSTEELAKAFQRPYLWLDDD